MDLSLKLTDIQSADVNMEAMSLSETQIADSTTFSVNLLGDEDGDPDDDTQQQDSLTINKKFDLNGMARPGPRRKTCGWCSNKKCNHCRCESYARCDHSSSEPCKRVRYGRRLVCNTCERNKLKDPSIGKVTKRRVTPAKGKKNGNFNLMIRTPNLQPFTQNQPFSDQFQLNLVMPPVFTASSSLAPAMETSLTNPPLGVAISAAAQQTALVAAMNVMNNCSQMKPQTPMEIGTGGGEDQECFELALQSLISAPNTPSSVSGLTMPLSPLMGFQLPSSFFGNNYGQYPSFSSPTTPNNFLDHSTFLDAMSSMDYFNESKAFHNLGGNGTLSQPISESECGSDKDSIHSMGEKEFMKSLQFHLSGQPSANHSDG